MPAPRGGGVLPQAKAALWDQLPEHWCPRLLSLVLTLYGLSQPSSTPNWEGEVTQITSGKKRSLEALALFLQSAFPASSKAARR